jgi:hypothetical protein
VGKLSEAELFSRNKFITDRIRMGMSRVVIERQFSESFGVKESVSRSSYQAANDSLIVIDPNHTEHTRAALIEVIYGQLAGVQHDISKISIEIQSVEAARLRRSNIQVQILSSIDANEITRLNRELKSVPQYREKYLISCLEKRSRFRLLVVKFVTEIARLNGLFVEELPILRAIQIMANSELIPAATASGLLSLLGNLESQIDRTGKVAKTDMN